MKGYYNRKAPTTSTSSVRNCNRGQFFRNIDVIDTAKEEKQKAKKEEKNGTN